MRTLFQMRPQQGKEPWWVRIRSNSGEVLGAGVLLDPHHVLTCAHVIPDPDNQVRLDLLRLPGSPELTARVLPDGWVPPDNLLGDLALLTMDAAAPGGTGAPLSMMAPWNRAVYTFGFPSGLDHGVWVRARLAADGGPGSEWIQVDTTSSKEITEGFSGAPVVDDETGLVLGIMVSTYTGQRSIAWAISVETIVRHLPATDRFVLDEASVDDRVQKHFGPGGSGGAMVLVDKDRPASDSLGRGGEGPTAQGFAHPLDVKGRTVEQVSTMVADALRGTTGRQGLVFDGVDEAADPGALVHKVIRPLVEAGHRVITGLRRESSELRGSLARPSMSRRLAVLEAQVDLVSDKERRIRRLHHEVAKRVTPLPDVSLTASDLRLGLRALKRKRDLTGLDECERRTEQRLQAAITVRPKLEALLQEYWRLRGRLEVLHANGGGALSEKDAALADLYSEARKSLYEGPTDLAAATVAVDRYADALRKYQ